MNHYFKILTTFALLAATNAMIFGGKVAARSKSTIPTYDKETKTWTKSPNDDGENPYDAVGALLRHGPNPFIARLTNPNDYEQGVLKYMAVANVERSEAVGNMDAKLNNAMDWAFQKQEEKKGKAESNFTREGREGAGEFCKLT